MRGIMWTLQIAGIELYFLLGWFWIYCFLGWVWESCYMSVVEGHPVNRGFVTGPFLTIYGFGALSVYLILRPLAGKWLPLFFCGAILATILEFVTAEVLEAVFHTRWWDYTEKKWNFQGKICPESTVCWGVFTLLMFYILQPWVSWIFRQIDVRAGKVVIVVITLIYCIDFGISAAAAFTMDHKIRKMEQLRAEFLEILQKNRLTGAAEEARQKFSAFRRETGHKVRVYPGKARKIMKNYMETLRQEGSQKLDGLVDYGTGKKEELNQRREKVKREILEHAEKLGITRGKSKKLLDLMVNSIYSNKEIFLRELISNASDAIDKLYFKSLTDHTVPSRKEDYKIHLTLDKDSRTITITDNGIGMTKEELENKIATLTGGRAAEELIFNSASTGASNDIEQATKLARAMITRYGMSEDFDMVAMETVNNQYLGGDTSLSCSAQTQAEIDRQVVELVKRQHEKAAKILADNREKLDQLADYLYERETITGEEFMKILENPTPVVEDTLKTSEEETDKI